MTEGCARHKMGSNGCKCKWRQWNKDRRILHCPKCGRSKWKRGEPKS